MFPITSIYAGLLGLVFLALSMRVIARRRAAGIGLGDGGDPDLQRRIRAQGNCAEYAPLGIVLLALVEGAGAPAAALHVLGLLLLGGRALHGLGLSLGSWRDWARVGGMALTLTMLGLASLGLLLHAAL